MVVGMPLGRYFVFAGSLLLALLFLSDWYLPPLAATPARGEVDRTVIRLRSGHKWPERIVMDTSIAMPAPAKLAKMDQPVRTAPVAAAEPAKSSARDAYAQMAAVEVNHNSAAAKAVEKPYATKLPDTTAKPVDVKKRKTAKAHTGKPMILVAQQPHFGLFESTW